MRRLGGEDGFGLVEAVVAMSIMSMISVAVLSAIVASERSIERGVKAFVATNEADSAVAELRSQVRRSDLERAVVSPDGTQLSIVTVDENDAEVWFEWRLNGSKIQTHTMPSAEWRTVVNDVQPEGSEPPFTASADLVTATFKVTPLRAPTLHTRAVIEGMPPVIEEPCPSPTEPIPTPTTTPTTSPSSSPSPSPTASPTPCPTI